MKKILGTAALALLCLGQASALEPISAIHGSGRWKGEIYAVSPSFSYHLAVQWNPETDVAPLAVPKAIAAARAELKKMVGDAQAHFACVEVKIAMENGYWFYVVMFYSEHPLVATMGKVGIIPASLPFIVHLDGTVEPPFKKLN